MGSIFCIAAIRHPSWRHNMFLPFSLRDRQSSMGRLDRSHWSNTHMPLRCMLHYANTSLMPLKVSYLDSYLVAESLDQVLAHTLFFIPFHILMINDSSEGTANRMVLPRLGLCYSTLSCQSSYLSSLSYLNYV